MNRTTLLQDRQIEKVKELLKRCHHVLQKAGQFESLPASRGRGFSSKPLADRCAAKKRGRPLSGRPRYVWLYAPQMAARYLRSVPPRIAWATAGMVAAMAGATARRIFSSSAVKPSAACCWPAGAGAG
jgi:hypothetical protein